MNREGNLKEYVYDAIMDELLSLKIQPGDILNEKALIEKYQCSKSPVREALITLCQEQVLRSIPRCGYEVVRLTKEDVDEMIHFRVLLECGFLQSGIQLVTGQDIKELRALNERCMIDDADVWEHWEYNTAFHLRMMEICQNKYAVESLKNCLARMKRAYAQAYSGKLVKSLFSVASSHHLDIIKALEEKDPEFLTNSIKEDCGWNSKTAVPYRVL